MINTQVESQDELKSVLNAIHDSINGKTRTLNITEHQALTTVYERWLPFLYVEKPIPPTEEQVKPKKSPRRCKKCDSTKTYIYEGSPRWHFKDGDTYCHKCYSKMFRHKK